MVVSGPASIAEPKSETQATAASSAAASSIPAVPLPATIAKKPLPATNSGSTKPGAPAASAVSSKAPHLGAKGPATLAAQQAIAAKAAQAALAAAAARSKQTASAKATVAVAARHSVREHKPSAKKRGSPPPPPPAQEQVTMATAATATQSASSKGGENTGRWTAEEHRLFLQGLEQHGKGWKKIASLIKSRTVVQIRTHAQKYFQKLAKARQNGEDGEISMDGRAAGLVMGGGAVGVGAGSKRRRQSSGTKRRAISTIVASAQREAKKKQQLAARQKARADSVASSVASSAAVTPSPSPPPPHVPVAPALAPFVAHPLPAPGQLPPPSAAPQHQPSQLPSITTSHGTISGAALEDSLFRFLTPVGGESVYHPPPPQVNDVARKAGANPITLPSESAAASANAAAFVGDHSPTGVTDLWIESKDAPAWYTSGRDVDELLHEVDALDWLADTGDLHETYGPALQVQPAMVVSAPPPPPLSNGREAEKDVASLCSENTGVTVTSIATVKRAEPSNGDITKEVMPPIPSTGFFPSPDKDTASAFATKTADAVVSSQVGPASSAADAVMSKSSPDADQEPPHKKQKVISGAAGESTASLFANATDEDHHLDVFDAHIDEQAFVSALLDNNAESSASFPALH